MPDPVAPTRVTRRTLLGASFAVLGASLTACSLRLEHDASLPGQKAGPAPDAAPLEAVRARLLAAWEAARQDADAAAKTAAGVHHTQLTRLDATLEGLGATALPPVPSVTSTPSPSSTSPSPSSGSTAKATATPTPTGPSSSPTSSTPTAWTRAEGSWASPAALRDLAGVSRASRPLAMAIAARSLATLPTAAPTPSWPDGLALAQVATEGIAPPLAAALAAQEWAAAKTAITQRAAVAARLRWLYAATSLVEAVRSAPASASPEPLRRFMDIADADRFTRTALLNVISRCADAADATLDANQAGGLLYVWSNAVATAQSMGDAQGPFPGLAGG